MNEHRINGFSEINGKTQVYVPFDFVEVLDDNYSFSNCVAVFSEPVGILARMNFKVLFYKEFTKDNFKNDTDRVNHTVYLIKSTEKDSILIIEDIMQGKSFNS